MNTPNRIQISPETEPGLHKRMILYIEDVVFPELLEHYWSIIFEKHKDPKYSFEISDPFHDCFKPVEKDDKSGTFTCLIPCLRPYWDIILALYHLYCPKLFPTTAHVAEALYDKIEEARKYKKDPTESFENYNSDIHSYLKGLFKKDRPLNGGYHNWFLSDPGETVYQAQRALMLLTKNFAGNETDEFIRQIEEVHQKQLIEKYKKENDNREPPEMFFFTDTLKVLRKETNAKARRYLEKHKGPQTKLSSQRLKNAKEAEEDVKKKKEQNEKVRSQLCLEQEEEKEDKDHQCPLHPFD